MYCPIDNVHYPPDEMLYSPEELQQLEEDAHKWHLKMLEEEQQYAEEAKIDELPF